MCQWSRINYELIYSTAEIHASHASTLHKPHATCHMPCTCHMPPRLGVYKLQHITQLYLVQTACMYTVDVVGLHEDALRLHEAVLGCIRLVGLHEAVVGLHEAVLGMYEAVVSCLGL